MDAELVAVRAVVLASGRIAPGRDVPGEEGMDIRGNAQPLVHQVAAVEPEVGVELDLWKFRSPSRSMSGPGPTADTSRKGLAKVIGRLGSSPSCSTNLYPRS